LHQVFCFAAKIINPDATMNPNQVFMYTQPQPSASPMYITPGVDTTQTSGYHPVQAQGVSPFTFFPAPSPTPEPHLQFVQVPCSAQMMQPYQLIPFPQGVPQVMAPMMQTSPPMTVYRPIQRQSHPLMQEDKLPVFGSSHNGMMDPSMQQWKRDPTASNFAWKRDPGFNNAQAPSPNLNANMPMNQVLKFNVNRNLSKQGPGGRQHEYSNVPRKSKKKFGFRSKQNMIDKVYLSLVEKYEKRGILAGDDEVLRGDDTIRLHVKKFKALQRIEEALQAAERIDSVTISRVSIPLSMKNQFQKKGFLVYVQVEEVWMVPLAQKIFRQFDEFKKCDVARHTADAEATKAEAASAEEVKAEEPEPMQTEEPAECALKEEQTEMLAEPGYGMVIVKEEKTDDLEDFDDLFAGPMIPQRSCGEMGQ